jgi:hypothetical protein
VIRDLALMFGAFIAATLLAELFGAANLGTAMTFGQIAFAATAVAIILRGDGARPPGQRGDGRG